MRMYAVIDTDHPTVGALTSYYRTVEEAEDHVAGMVRHSRVGETPGCEFLRIEVVERDSFPCVICSGEVTSKNPEKYPYCRNCHHMGRAAEHVAAAQMDYFREQLPEVNVSIDHTGGGCFWLAFYHPDRQEYIIATDGDASLPAEQDEDGEWQRIRGGWGCVAFQGDCSPACREEEAKCDESCNQWQTLAFVEYDGEGPDAVRPEDQLLSDEQVVAYVRDWIDGRLIPDLQPV